MRVLAKLVVVGAALACAGSPTLALTPSPLTLAEEAYASLRALGDGIALAQARAVSRTEAGETLDQAVTRWPQARARLEAALARLPTEAGTDARAVAEMRRALAAELASAPEPEVQAAQPDCGYDPASLDLEALTARVYACYGHAASNISLDGKTLDRLTVLGLLGTTEDPAQRRRLFLALEPVWRSVNGDHGPGSPYRRLLALRARDPKLARGLLESKAAELDLEPAALEAWIVAILEAWRGTLSGPPREPWDHYFGNAAASRALGPRIARGDLERLNARFYRDLGADPVQLGVRYDLEPRPGKTPVAFTNFGRRAGGGRPTVPWVFATYRVGGLDNLAELVHETGHAVHLAAIRTRPAFLDWPDSDTFTEAIADLVALDVHEPAWQQRYLGRSVPLAEGLRSRYSGIAMDAAWSLFELRLHRDPGLDPDQVWAEITSRYLGLVPHPEWSWWAMRGQLIDSPGYLANYAAGAVLTADIRARTKAQRGSTAAGDPGWYDWISARLLRFGRERASAELLREFLGRSPTPDALLADLARGTPSKR
jgi:hypothetical protein